MPSKKNSGADAVHHRRSFAESKEGYLLRSFRAGSVPTIAKLINRYFREEYMCNNVAIVNLINNTECKIFCANENIHNESFQIKSLAGVSQAIASVDQIPILHSENLNSWNQIFEFVPSILVLVPTICNPEKPTKSTRTLKVVTVLGFITELPHQYTNDAFWNLLIAACRLISPVGANTQRYHSAHLRFKKASVIIDSIRHTEKEIQDISHCVYSIGLELQTMLNCTHAAVFVTHADDYEPLLLKYGQFGTAKIDNHCPDKECHHLHELPQSTLYPAGWSALHKKILRINDHGKYMKLFGYRHNGGFIHSIGGCIVKNIMCILVDDASMDMPIIVELSNKTGGFTEDDERQAILFAKLASHVISSAVMLDYRKKAIRQSDITNELLNNIKTVQFTKVKHVLDMKFQYSNSFQKRFYTARFTLRRLMTEQYPGVILYMFTELGFINRWKIRRVTLIRFILSIKQGYIDNPYHNWKHACTVTHFAFFLLKKMELQRQGYLTDMEAFSLIVACLCHDISHRGLNNHFSLVNKEETGAMHLYKLEESLLERHHVAVSLQVLASDDCNIAENLSVEEYREFVQLIQRNIIATDIGKYLQERSEMFSLMKKFNKKNPEHRLVLMSLMMTTCDLCECIKPWNYYLMTVKSIFSEFFTQGDEELRVGHQPTPIMDKRIAYIPYIEMKFINEIVRPVYEVMARLFPKAAEDCLYTIDYFKDLWLVATKVFDENLSMENPLDVLDLEEMEEDVLKREDNPQLEKQANAIRRTIRLSLPLLPLRKTGKSLQSTKSIAASSQFLSTHSDEDLVAIARLIGQRDNKCRAFISSTKDIMCCLKCRRKGLRDAMFIRRTNYDTEFMEIRCEDYERRRSVHYPEVVVLDKQRLKERISHLINPH